MGRALIPPRDKKDAKECNHLEGTWKRVGRFAIDVCSKGDYALVMDINSQEAFNLFEGRTGAVQLFGTPLKPLEGDDAERYQSFIDAGFNPKSLEVASPSATTEMAKAIKELRGFAWQFKHNGDNPSLHAEFSKFIDRLESTVSPETATEGEGSAIRPSLNDGERTKPDSAKVSEALARLKAKVEERMNGKDWGLSPNWPHKRSLQWHKGHQAGKTDNLAWVLAEINAASAQRGEEGK